MAYSGRALDWRESATGGLPEDLAHEYEALRGDIADELDDHLLCAMKRELRRTDDESAAERAVLERFGDSRKVARQLWCEAIKEKVMRDRILIWAIVVITLCKSACVLRGSARCAEGTGGESGDACANGGNASAGHDQ